MNERTQWTDPALNREFERVYKQINGTPERMTRMEEAFKVVGREVQSLRKEHEEDMQELKDELRGSKWSRTQIIGALGVLAAFASSGAAVAAVVLG